MINRSPAPILNTLLPSQFRKIRLELAREPGLPEGAATIADGSSPRSTKSAGSNRRFGSLTAKPAA
jgi:hypothetical protein